MQLQASTRVTPGGVQQQRLGSSGLYTCAGAAPAPVGGRGPGRRRLVVAAGLGDVFRDIFDFESWAPKSSQAWRLGNGTDKSRRNGADNGTLEQKQQDAETLSRRLAEAAEQQAAAAPSDPAERPAASSSSGQLEQQEQPSFLRSTDEEFSSALNDRISQMAGEGPSSSSGSGAAGSDAEARPVLTGSRLRELVYSKWGKQYDLSFVRRDLPLGKVLVCLNVMWVHMEQRSFPMTEEEFDDKMDMMAYYLNSWEQSERVITFLEAPARPRKGMPSKPIVGTAVSIHLELPPGVVDEFFGQGGA